MLGEIAIYSLAVLVVTGVFLMFFFDPDATQVVYDGSYTLLRGVPVSKAFASTLEVSFEVRGGLLARQVHHWATLVFTAAVCLHLLRLFFTGAFRRPRGLNWLIWIGLFTLGMAAGVTGGILPDDMLSGGSVSLLRAVTQAIPVVGTWLAQPLYGDHVIPLLYWIHVLFLPSIMAGLLVFQRRLPKRHGYSLSSLASFFATCGVLTMLATAAQVNPVWLYGPHQPGQISAGSVPAWYMGFLDGAIRIMPAWEPIVWGHPLSLSVLIPALVVPGAFFTALAAYPLLDRRLSGGRTTLDRPREAAGRTALGAAGATFYVILWVAASNDQLAFHFDLSLFAVTRFFRIAVFVGPVVAFEVTRRLCLALQRQEHEPLETGIIRRTLKGGYTEEYQNV